MKKKTELAPSELRANHSLKGTIKGPGPAKIIFKKKSSRKGKHWEARPKMKLVQITFRVIGERQNKPPPQPSGKPHKPHKLDWSCSPPRSHLLTAFFLQCFNLKKKKEKKKKRERREKRKRKRKEENLPIVRPPIHLSFKVNSLCINYHRLPGAGRPNASRSPRLTPCLCYLYAEPDENFILILGDLP